MNIDELNIKLRADFTSHIKPLVAKDKCEVCNTTENLEVHHEKLFAEQLNNILDMLHIEDYENISDELVEQIRLMMLGSQIKEKHITLCSKCHDEEHRTQKKLYKTKRAYIIKTKPKVEITDISKEITNELEQFLTNSYKNDDRLDKEYFRETVDNIINNDENLKIIMNRLDGGNSRTKGMKIYNKLFDELSLPYGIISKRFREDGKLETEWIVTKNDIINKLN